MNRPDPCSTCHKPPADESRPATLGPGESCGCNLTDREPRRTTMTAAIEPVGGWPAELAKWSGKVWTSPGGTIDAPLLRDAWTICRLGGQPFVGAYSWPKMARILKRHNLIRYNRETRRWEALRVPA